MDKYKEILKKLILRQNITNEELNLFLLMYIERNNKKEPTSEQLLQIKNLLYSGIFNIQYIIEKSIEEFEVVKIIDIDSNEIIRVDIY